MADTAKRMSSPVNHALTLPAPCTLTATLCKSCLYVLYVLPTQMSITDYYNYDGLSIKLEERKECHLVFSKFLESLKWEAIYIKIL